MARRNSLLLCGLLPLLPGTMCVKLDSLLRDHETMRTESRSTRTNGSAAVKAMTVVAQPVNRRPNRVTAVVNAHGQVESDETVAKVTSLQSKIQAFRDDIAKDDAAWFMSSSPASSSPVVPMDTRIRTPAESPAASPASSSPFGWMWSSSAPASSSPMSSFFSAFMQPHWKYINNHDVGKELTYPKRGSSVPECWQGLWFMDQNYMTQDLLDDTTYYFTSNVYGRDIPDYAISVLDEWDGVCVKFGFVDRSSWGYTEVKMNPLMGCPPNDQEHQGTTSFCLENYLTHGPCDEGAIYATNETRDQLGYHMSMTMKRTHWGWDRITKAEPKGLTANVVSLGSTDYYNYPVVPIVDADGRQTQFFETYVREANNEFDCVTEGTSQIMMCPKNENEYGMSLICTSHT